MQAVTYLRVFNNSAMVTSLAGIDQPPLRTGCRPVSSADREGPHTIWA